jgi:tetratricopeptide (TPR) repeat protein
MAAKARRRRLDRRKLAARAAIVAVAVLASWVALRSAAGGWLSVAHPAEAEALAPGDARADLAAAIALSSDKRMATRSNALAGAALERDVTDPRAIELLALADDKAGRHKQADNLFHLSDAIGRRSLPTRLWLIQASVDAGNVAGALRHFDIALRTAPEAGSLLYPVLARASTQPALVAPIAALLDRPSDWRLPFFHTDGTASGVAAVALRMKDRRWLLANHVDETLIAGLVTEGAYRQAATVSTAFHPSINRAGALLRDGNFADAAQRYPFGWQLEQSAEMEATRATLGGHPVLRYEARLGGSGAAATQLLQLAQGRYRLTVRVAAVGSDPGAQPFWTLTCAGEDGEGGMQLALLEQAPDLRRPNSADFTVGEHCEAQWLSLHLRSSDSTESQSGAISAVTMEKRG